MEALAGTLAALVVILAAGAAVVVVVVAEVALVLEVEVAVEGAQVVAAGTNRS